MDNTPQSKGEGEWIWLSALMDEKLFEVMFEAAITFDQIMGLEAMPERIIYRKFVMVRVRAVGEKTEADLSRLYSQSSPECIGTVDTKKFINIAIADPEAVVNARKLFGEKAILVAKESQLRKL